MFPPICFVRFRVMLLSFSQEQGQGIRKFVAPVYKMTRPYFGKRMKYVFPIWISCFCAANALSIKGEIALVFAYILLFVSFRISRIMRLRFARLFGSFRCCHSQRTDWTLKQYPPQRKAAGAHEPTKENCECFSCFYPEKPCKCTGVILAFRHFNSLRYGVFVF